MDLAHTAHGENAHAYEPDNTRSLHITVRVTQALHPSSELCSREPVGIEARNKHHLDSNTDVAISDANVTLFIRRVLLVLPGIYGGMTILPQLRKDPAHDSHDE